MAAIDDKYEEVYIRNLFADQQQVLWTAGCECIKSIILSHINVSNFWHCYQVRAKHSQDLGNSENLVTRECQN